MKFLKKAWGYLLLCTLMFYIAPLICTFVPDFSFIFAIALLFIIFPAMCFLCGVVYGVKNGFSLVLPVWIGLIFVPALLIYYNYTAWSYSAAFLVITLLGSAIGAQVKRLRT